MSTSATSDATSAAEAPAPATHTRPWALVAAREIRVKLTDRNFLISTGITLLLVVALLGVQAFLASQDSAPEYTVAVTSADGEALVAQAESALKTTDDGATVTPVIVADATAGEALLTSEEADAFLLQDGDEWTLSSDGGAPGDLEAAVTDAVRSSALATNAEEAGTSLPALMDNTELTTDDISGDGTQEIVLAVAGIVFGALFYMASLVFGLSIANSVVEEKQSRIVEILAAVIPTRSLLAGKVLGNTVLAFGQMAIFVGVALIGLSFTEYDAFLPVMREPLLWYLPFFVAGFIALASIWAAAGALASRVEDLQSTTMPLTLTLVAVFVIALNLDGTAEVIGSYVPVMSTILMPIRLLAEEAAWWEPVVAMALTLAFCYASILFGSTLYRRALMQTQGRVSVRQALRISD